MEAINFMKTYFEKKETTTQPLQKEEEFCRYLCSILKNIKIEANYDALTLEILTLANKKILEEKIQIKSENYFLPISDHNVSIPMSTPSPFSSISSSRFSGKSSINTPSPVTPITFEYSSQSTNEPFLFQSLPRTSTFVSTFKNSSETSSSLPSISNSVETFPPPQQNNSLYVKFQNQLLNSSRHTPNTPSSSKQISFSSYQHLQPLLNIKSRSRTSSTNSSDSSITTHTNSITTDTNMITNPSTTNANPSTTSKTQSENKAIILENILLKEASKNTSKHKNILDQAFHSVFDEFIIKTTN